MVQPLSRVSPSAKFSLGRVATISNRPDLALKVMEVISIWSSVDSEILSLATELLKADYVAVASMLNAIVSAEARAAAIANAAQAVMSDEDFAMFLKIRDTTKASRKKRNEFAHHIWISSDDLPDALLLVDPKNIASVNAKKKHSDHELLNILMYSPSKVTVEDLTKGLSIDRALVGVYRMGDLEFEVDAAKRSFRLHNQFRAWMFWESGFRDTKEGKRRALRCLLDDLGLA